MNGIVCDTHNQRHSGKRVDLFTKVTNQTSPPSDTQSNSMLSSNCTNVLSSLKEIVRMLNMINFYFNSTPQYDNFHFSIKFHIWALFLIQLSFNLEDRTINHWRWNWKSKWQAFQKNLCRMQLSATVATSAITPAPQLLTSRRTCGNIREKSLSSAINVASLVPQLVISSDTYWLIQVKSHSVVRNVTSLAH